MRDVRTADMRSKPFSVKMPFFPLKEGGKEGGREGRRAIRGERG